MRALVAILGAVLLPAAACTQAPVPAGTVILKITGTGVIHSVPDLVILHLTVVGNGATIADARADRDRRTADLKTRLAGIGIGDAVIETETNPATEMLLAMGPMGGGASKPQRAQQGLVVTVSSPKQEQQVRDAIAQIDSVSAQPSVLKLRDSSRAHREAIAAAVAMAREDAATYAAALGLGIVGIQNATNSVGVGPIIQDITQNFRPQDFGRGMATKDVTTEARVEIDFIARPK